MNITASRRQCRASPQSTAPPSPAVWPDDRYDVIWTFALDPDGGHYVFGQVRQQLLDGDSDAVI